MRLFTAIDLPAGVRGQVAGLLTRLRPLARFRWSPPENLHITTKFIGDWPEDRLAELERALAGVRATPFAVNVSGFGWFPNPHHPKSLFAGVRAGESLPALAAATNAACERLGIALETKRFHPHLTLARIQDETGLAGVRREIAALPEAALGEFTASSFGLFASKMGPGGSKYTLLKEFALE